MNAGVGQCRQDFVVMQAVMRKMTGGNLAAMTALDREEAKDASSNALQEEAAAARFQRRVLRLDRESADNQRRNDDAVMSAMIAARSSRSSFRCRCKCRSLQQFAFWLGGNERSINYSSG